MNTNLQGLYYVENKDKIEWDLSKLGDIPFCHKDKVVELRDLDYELGSEEKSEIEDLFENGNPGFSEILDDFEDDEQVEAAVVKYIADKGYEPRID